jgi:hypothetical protein
VLGATLLSPAVASAQEQVELPVFSPSFAGDRFFGVPSPYTASDGIFNVHGGRAGRLRPQPARPRELGRLAAVVWRERVLAWSSTS